MCYKHSARVASTARKPSLIILSRSHGSFIFFLSSTALRQFRGPAVLASQRFKFQSQPMTMVSGRSGKTASLWAIQMFYITTGMAMPGAASPSPLGFISNEAKCVRRQDPWVDNTFFILLP